MGNGTENAIKYAQLCMEWSKQAGRKYGLCGCRAQLGNIYHNADMLDSAEYHTRAALTMAEQIGDQYVVPSLFMGLSDIAEKRKQYDIEQEWL
jgi:hypothetical protein